MSIETEYDDLDEIQEDEEDRGDEVEDLDDEDEDISEDEDEDVEYDEEDEEGDGGEDTSDIQIPKRRFDQVIAQREQERERVRWLEDQLEKLIDQKKPDVKEEVPVPTYDFDTAEEKYVELLLEGETKQAASLRKEINKARDEYTTYQINQIKESLSSEVVNSSKAAADQSKFDSLVENYENKYPYLDHESDSYDEEAVDMVNTLLSGYVSKGLSKSEALTKAVKGVSRHFGEPVKGRKLGNDSTNRRSKVKAARQQPAKSGSNSRVRNRNTSDLDFNRMSEKEFNSLSERELKIARGDVV